MDRTLKRAKRKNKRRRNPQPWGLATVLPRRDHLPLLPPRQHQAPLPVGAASLLPEGHGSGTAGPLREAVQLRYPGQRLDAGEADDCRQPRRAHYRLLRSLR